MNYKANLKEYLDREIEVIRSLDLDSVNAVMNVLEDAKARHKTTYVCGNGGSAATASHFVCDFNKGLNDEASQFKFQCLSDNVPIMMAISNDIGYDEVFRYQIKGRIEAGDILLGISGSGNSINVINAMEHAKKVGASTIALVGYDGGKMKQIADYCIHVNIDNMQISEDIHMILDHLMMSVIGHGQRYNPRKRLQECCLLRNEVVEPILSR